MPIAFMLVSVDQESEVLTKLLQIEGTQAYMIYGPYNIIARFEAETMNTLSDLMKRARVLVRKYCSRREYEEGGVPVTLVVAE